MPPLPKPQKSMLYGAVGATVTGLLFGLVLKVEVAPTSSYGQQLLVSKPSDRAPSAFDDWYPAEAAPPPAYIEAALREDASAGDDIDRQIARLLNFGRADTLSDEPIEQPIQVAQRAPDRPAEPYPPSEGEDVPASSTYDPPPSDPPRWGWALPDALEAPYPADRPPEIYEEGAAG